MALTPERRQQLDGIVQQMASQNASSDEVHAVVNDFLGKYGQEVQAPAQMQKPDISAFDPNHPIMSSLAGLGKQFAGVVPGFAKGVGSTIAGASTLGEKLMRTPLQAAGLPTMKSTPLGAQVQQSGMLTPQGAGQQVGYGAEKMAELMIPGEGPVKTAGLLERGALESLPTAAVAGKGILPSVTRKLIGTGARAATEAGVFGGQTALESGGDAKQTAASAAFGALFPMVGTVVKELSSPLKEPVAKGLVGLGERIQKVLIKPTKRDIENGFKIENLRKNNIGGNLQQMMAKTADKLNGLYDNLQGRLATAPKTVNVNLKQIVNDTEKELVGKQSEQFGKNLGIKRALQELRGEVGVISKNQPFVDLLQATNIKRGAGTKGAWLYGSQHPDADALETVYTAFYRKMKSAIEDAAQRAGVPEIADINKQMSELIPIQSALIRRIPVAERNDIAGLFRTMETLGAMMNPKLWGVMGIHELLKSGTAAEGMIKTGERMLTPTEASTAVGKRLFGGTTPLGPAAQARGPGAAGAEMIPPNVPIRGEYAGLHQPPMSGEGAPIYDLTGKTGDWSVYPEDIYSSNASRYYGHSAGDSLDHQAIAAIQKVKDKPNATLTVYRAVPKIETKEEIIKSLEKKEADFLRRGRYPKNEGWKSGSEYYAFLDKKLEETKSLPDSKNEPLKIERGNWVTTVRDYAKQHGESALNGKYRILQKTVKAKELFTDGNSPFEFGYDPTK